MAITPLPPAPSRAVPSTFSKLADAFLGALSTFVTEANALEVNVNAKETLVANYYNATLVAYAAAIAAANYKGEWSSLTGAATIPYCVSHLGRFWMLSSNLTNVAAKTPGTDAEWLPILADYSCENGSSLIQYPIPTSGYMLKAGADGSPATGTNTDSDVADAVSKKHTQNTDTGTTATNFKINTGGNEADLQTTGLTGDRDYTFPDVDTMLAGAVVMTQNTFEIIAYT
jgi:hypothetical protein